LTGRRRVDVLEPALTMTFLLAFAIPFAESPSGVTLRAERAQELLNDLRTTLHIEEPVQVSVVTSHPFVFAVKPMDTEKSNFILSMEMGFLLMLEEDELRAALAHELGHVWLFTHHPFLHTERLANSIGMRAVNRDSFARLYSKLWVYEGTSGAAMDELLGANPAASSKPPY
jgi:hypothetical protein